MDINSTSLALQNYYSQQGVRAPEEKQVNTENFDDSDLVEMSHFKVDSPLFSKPEP